MGVFNRIEELKENSGIDVIKVDYAKKQVNAELTVVDFEDHNYIIMYSPGLRLSAYGNSKEEAMDMLLNVVIDDFFETIINMPEPLVFAELSKLGWSTRGREERDFISSVFIDKEGILRDFNLPEETQIHTSLVTV